jgi:hypothetical protein
MVEVGDGPPIGNIGNITNPKCPITGHITTLWKLVQGKIKKSMMAKPNRFNRNKRRT